MGSKSNERFYSDLTLRGRDEGLPLLRRSRIVVRRLAWCVDGADWQHQVLWSPGAGLRAWLLGAGVVSVLPCRLGSNCLKVRVCAVCFHIVGI